MNSSYIGSRLLLIMAIFSIGSVNQANANSYKSHEIKAVYIYRIANFIRWDNEKNFNSLKFCIQDNREIENALQVIAKKHSIRTLPVKVSSIIDETCHVAFVNGVSNVSKLSSHVVTISDHESFTESGGVIQLEHINNKIKPKISLKNSASRSYTIGSNLLRISTLEGK